jgi:hypothetical protein
LEGFKRAGDRSRGQRNADAPLPEINAESPH